MKKLIFLIVIVGIVAAVIYVPAVHDPVMKILGKAKDTAVEIKDDTVDMGTPTDTIRGKAVKVFYIRNGEYYHTRGCKIWDDPKNAERKAVLTLEKAKAAYRPCPHCNPPQ